VGNTELLPKHKNENGADFCFFFGELSSLKLRYHISVSTSFGTTFSSCVSRGCSDAIVD